MAITQREVYRVHSDTWVGYVPLVTRLARMSRTLNYGRECTYAKGYIRSFVPNTPVIRASELALAGINAYHYFHHHGYDKMPYSLMREDCGTTEALGAPGAPYSTWFLSTLMEHPRLPAERDGLADRTLCVYMFEDFMLDNSPGEILWSPYSMRGQWEPLQSLAQLPQTG